jgi:hypothetical protein
MQPAIPHFPDAIDLTGLFMIAWPRVDPTLAEDALVELPHVGAGLPPERARVEAVLWIWQEDLSVIDTSGLSVLRVPPDGRVENAQRVLLSPWAFDGPEVRAFLSGLPGAFSPLSHARLMLEVRVQRVLAWIVEQVRAGELRFEAAHPRTHQPFEPDPTLIEGLFGSNRWRGQIPTDNGTISHLRFEAVAEHQAPGAPVQPELPGMIRRPARTRYGTHSNEVLDKMRKDGVAKVEAMKGIDRAQHYGTTDRTARRALARLRQEEQPHSDEPSKSDK